MVSMRLSHLGLPVRDQQRSLDFYHTHFWLRPGHGPAL
jgi:catechol 2,3-dioxygenase-like lactoylglutathione lyase family enzyme